LLTSRPFTVDAKVPIADDKHNLYLDDVTHRAVRGFPSGARITLTRKRAHGVAITFADKSYTLHVRDDAVAVPAGENVTMSLLYDPHDTDAYAVLRCVPLQI